MKLQSGPVQHPDDMDDDTFCKHMSYRHHDDLGGLDEIIYINGRTVDAWRAFHDRLHNRAFYPFGQSHDHLEDAT